MLVSLSQIRSCTLGRANVFVVSFRFERGSGKTSIIQRVNPEPASFI